MTDTHPHVSERTAAIVERYRDKITNTGGNDPLDLLDDLSNPARKNMAATNVVRFSIAFAVLAQVQLLAVLENDGTLTTPEPEEQP